MELYDRIDDLKKKLDNEESIISIKTIQKEILLNKDLISNIYNNSYDKNNGLVLKYRHLENEVNYIILEINMNLKKIIGSDCNEGNSR